MDIVVLIPHVYVVIPHLYQGPSAHMSEQRVQLRAHSHTVHEFLDQNYALRVHQDESLRLTVIVRRGQVLVLPEAGDGRVDAPRYHRQPVAAVYSSHVAAFDHL